MVIRKSESPIEGEVVEEVKLNGKKKQMLQSRSRSGLFFGVVLLVWGLAIILDTYFSTELMRNFWPLIAIVFGVYLITSSF